MKDTLRGKSIVFIGDSLTRYQYLNLVYFLATGKWSSPHPRNELDKEHASWQSFYRTTTQRNQNEICDCYRLQLFPHREAGLSSLVENRSFSVLSKLIFQISFLKCQMKCVTIIVCETSWTLAFTQE